MPEDDLTEFQDKLGTTANQMQRNSRGATAEACPPAGNPASPALTGDDIQWAVLPNNTFTAVGQTASALPIGVFGIEMHPNTGQLLFIARKIITDELIVLPDTASARVLAAVAQFWTARERFEQYKQLYKRGIMMWGPPGGGKTATLMLLFQDLVKQDGIVILANHPIRTAQGLEILRRIEPKRPIICVLEDVDETIQEHGEHELLALLDGESQIDNVVFIATTNYPERLDKRLINRPSRFDEIIKVGMPSPEARRVYLEHRLGADFADMDAWVADSDNFSVAHLRELVVAVFCLDRDYKGTIERLRRMAYTPKSDGSDNKVGF